MRSVVHFVSARYQKVQAGFTTRHLPVRVSKSEDLRRDDIQKALRAHLAGLPGRFAFLEQVHGGTVVTLEEAALRSDFQDFTGADGFVTCLDNIALLVLSADCLPIYYWHEADKNAKRWIGLVHAGWKGTQAQIAANAFRLMAAGAGGRADRVHVALGPCIRWPHYEVGPEFEERFPASSLRRKGGKLYFDLPGENRRQLIAAGARPENIMDTEICTFASPHFFSFRKEKEHAGRIVSFIAKRSER